MGSPLLEAVAPAATGEEAGLATEGAGSARAERVGRAQMRAVSQ